MGDCNKCGGTGYNSAAREAGMLGHPNAPLGIWECERCGGTGKDWEPPELTAEEKEELAKIMAKLLKDYPPKET